MRGYEYDQLIAALEAHGIDHTACLNILSVTTRKPPKRRDKPAIANDEWKKILRSTQLYYRRLMSNRPRWEPGWAALMDQYGTLIQKVLTKMQAAADSGTAHADFQRQVEETNRTRAASGQARLATCTAHWGTWIPDHVKQAYTDQIARYAADNGRRGQPFIPFIARQQITNAKARMAKHRTTFALVRQRMQTMDGTGTPTGQSHIPYNALWLAAVRQAEIELDRRAEQVKLGRYSGEDVSPLPVNWLHLCDDRMRTHLRRAEADPRDVDAESLTHYLNPSLDTPTTRQIHKHYADVDAGGTAGGSYDFSAPTVMKADSGTEIPE